LPNQRQRPTEDTSIGQAVRLLSRRLVQVVDVRVGCFLCGYRYQFGVLVIVADGIVGGCDII
jgi:hypothetical protein